jgi:hypothetical protein
MKNKTGPQRHVFMAKKWARAVIQNPGLGSKYIPVGWLVVGLLIIDDAFLFVSSMKDFVAREPYLFNPNDFEEIGIL